MKSVSQHECVSESGPILAKEHLRKSHFHALAEFFIPIYGEIYCFAPLNVKLNSELKIKF